MNRILPPSQIQSYYKAKFPITTKEHNFSPSKSQSIFDKNKSKIKLESTPLEEKEENTIVESDENNNRKTNNQKKPASKVSEEVSHNEDKASSVNFNDVVNFKKKDKSQSSLTRIINEPNPKVTGNHSPSSQVID